MWADAEDPNYRTLYYQWENEQWATGEIDLDEDRRQWDEAISEESKRWVVHALEKCRMQGRGFGELSLLADEAATEDQQIFITTQLADTARQAVFFDRYGSEVTHDVAPTTGDPAPHEASFEVGTAVSELRSLIDFLDGEDLLPGLRQGLTAIARDHERHLAYAAMFRREADVGPNPT